MVRATLNTSPFTSMYWRDCQDPSGSSRSRSRSSSSDCSISVRQASSTVSWPYFSISASMRSRATLLQAIIEDMSSATISGERTMFSMVSITSWFTVPPLTSLMPGEENPSVKMSGASGQNPPGLVAPMS